MLEMSTYYFHLVFQGFVQLFLCISPPATGNNRFPRFEYLDGEFTISPAVKYFESCSF